MTTPPSPNERASLYNRLFALKASLSTTRLYDIEPHASRELFDFLLIDQRENLIDGTLDLAMSNDQAGILAYGSTMAELYYFLGLAYAHVHGIPSWIFRLFPDLPTPTGPFAEPTYPTKE